MAFSGVRERAQDRDLGRPPLEDARREDDRAYSQERDAGGHRFDAGRAGHQLGGHRGGDHRRADEVIKLLHARLGKHANNPKAKKIADKVEELKEKMRQNLITSIEFLKQLLEAAKELLEAEKEIAPEDNRARAKAALTELFETVKVESGKKNLIVENIVNDIDDQVVRVIRTFNDAFATVAGKREVRQLLRSILWVRYQIKDQDVFEKAYNYVEQYY